MSDAIANAIANATRAAEAATQAGSNVAVMSQDSTSGAVAVAAPAGQAFSMETLATGSINVDAWMKVSQFGLLIGDNKTSLIDTIKVSMEMTDGKGFVPKLSIKGGNPAQYWSTYDGVSAQGGGSWEQAQLKAKALSPTAYAYRCVDLPFTVLEPVVVKGVEVAKAGLKLGHSTSTTNWKNWETFYKDVAAAGLMNQTVELELGYEPKENKAGNNWGVVTFKLIGALQESE